MQRLLNLDEEGSSILLIILFVFIPLALAVLLIWFRRDRAKRQDGVYSFNNDLRGKK